MHSILYRNTLHITIWFLVMIRWNVILIMTRRNVIIWNCWRRLHDKKNKYCVQKNGMFVLQILTFHIHTNLWVIQFHQNTETDRHINFLSTAQVTHTQQQQQINKNSYNPKLFCLYRLSFHYTSRQPTQTHICSISIYTRIISATFTLRTNGLLLF